MSYSKTSIIQLREADSISGGSDLSTAGTWENNISPYLLLDDQDEISLKSAFIDSVDSSSGKIKITKEEGENMSISFYHYILNYDTANKAYNEGQPPTIAQPDGKHYFLCDTNDASVNSRKLTEIKISKIGGSGMPGSWGHHHIQIEYVPASQTTAEPKAYFDFYVPPITKGSTYKQENIDVLFNNAFPVDISLSHNDFPEIVKRHIDTSSIVFESVVVSNGSKRTAHQFKVDFTVDEGSYDPDELSRIINDKLTNINDSSGYLSTFPMDNELLTTNGQFNIDYPQPNNNVFYCSEDGTDFYRYTAGEYLSGTSQFSLQYDPGTDKMIINIMNCPYYEGSQIAVQSKEQGVGTGNFFIVNKNSGIVLNSLEPSTVWFEKMGFDANILVHPKSNTSDIGGLLNQTLPRFTGNDFPYPQQSIEEGVNMTGSFKGLDICINKTAAGGDAHGQQVIELDQIKATTLTQNQIYAFSSMSKTKYTYGYYMLEIDFGIPQQLKGNSFNNSKIQSIIGRYYSNNSYTSAYNEGSIPYVHRGQSVRLNKFKIRILKDDGTIADDIGINNTIFLELIKNVKPPSSLLLPLTLPQFEEVENEENQKNK